MNIWIARNTHNDLIHSTFPLKFWNWNKIGRNKWQFFLLKSYGLSLNQFPCHSSVCMRISWSEWMVFVQYKMNSLSISRDVSDVSLLLTRILSEYPRNSIGFFIIKEWMRAFGYKTSIWLRTIALWSYTYKRMIPKNILSLFLCYFDTMTAADSMQCIAMRCSIIVCRYGISMCLSNSVCVKLTTAETAWDTPTPNTRKLLRKCALIDVIEQMRCVRMKE